MAWVTGTRKEGRFKGRQEYRLHSWQVYPRASEYSELNLLLSLQFFFSDAHILTYLSVGAALAPHLPNVYRVSITCKGLGWRWGGRSVREKHTDGFHNSGAGPLGEELNLFPQFSLLISSHFPENTVTNRPLPAKRAHSLQSSQPLPASPSISPQGRLGSMHEDFKEALKLECMQHFLLKKKKRREKKKKPAGAGILIQWGRGAGVRDGIWQKGTMRWGSGLRDTFGSRDENSSFAADNICFILKVAKESSSWANIVPVQYFIESLFAQGWGGRNKSSPDKPCSFHSADIKESLCYQGWLTPRLVSLRIGWTLCLLSYYSPSPSPPLSPLANSPSLPNNGLLGRNKTVNVSLAWEEVSMQRQERAEEWAGAHGARMYGITQRRKWFPSL